MPVLQPLPKLSTLGDVNLTSLTKGALLWFDGSKFAVVPPDTAGKLLQTHSTSSIPTWVAGILADGSVPFSGNQSMGGNKLTSLGTPTSSTDAATKAYVDSATSGAGAVLADGSVPLSADWNAGARKLTIAQLAATIVTGTAPLVVNSTTLCANLNADYVDGHHSSDLVLCAGTQAFTGNQSLGGFKLTGLGTPTATGDAATKGYVDTVAAGFVGLPGGAAQGNLLYNGASSTAWLATAPVGQLLATGGSGANPYFVELGLRAAVKAVATTNGTLSTAFANGQTVDGYTLQTGDRILLAGQSTASQNGIYVVAASGSPSRAADLPSGASANGVLAWVQKGTNSQNTVWVCSTAPGSDVVGTNNLVFRVAFVPGGNSQAQGDIPTYTSTGWGFLPAGSQAGGLMKTGGAGANSSYSTLSYEDANGKLHLQAAAGTVVALGTQSTAATLDANTGTDFTLTTAGTCALTVSDLGAGQSVKLWVTQGSGGSHTVTFSGVKLPGGSITLSTAAAAVDLIVIANNGTITTAVVAGLNFS